MFSHMLANNVKSISMPEIGCGLDLLEWPKVEEILQNLIAGTDIQITVYHYKPKTSVGIKKSMIEGWKKLGAGTPYKKGK